MRSAFLYDLLIKQAVIVDGSAQPSYVGDVAVKNNHIVAIGKINAPLDATLASTVVDGKGLVLAPGFIDVHTHDDLELIRNPAMLAKVSQGITTVIVGNCGISASPYLLDSYPPDPINLLGQQNEFIFPTLNHYVDELARHKPAVNVVALIGHTALRAQVMDDLSKAANDDELIKMRALLVLALEQGAKGLSTGLAYFNAKAATADEVEFLARELKAFDAIYTTHLRTEFDGIISALDEAFLIGEKTTSPVVISHLKCAGKQNWGRAQEVLTHVVNAQKKQDICCDSYPYHASSSTLDLNQVTDDFDIFITWSEAAPEMAGKTLAAIAQHWQLSLLDAAKKLIPAGAVYHGMSEQDVEQFIQFEKGMIGSDGLPCDPHPHPRLWGAFPRVLGHFSREKQLLSLELAVHKMTGLSASNFAIEKRGLIKVGYFADLVLFDPEKVVDTASFTQPCEISQGIENVWVNGQLTYQYALGVVATDDTRAGLFLKHKLSTNFIKQI